MVSMPMTSIRESYVALTHIEDGAADGDSGSCIIDIYERPEILGVIFYLLYKGT